MRARILLLAAVALLCAGCGGDPQSAATGPRAAAAADLTGVRWLPADGAAGGRAYAEFAPDGTWTGSDGCNGQGGTWSLDADGTFTATANPSTLIGCENVPVAQWVSSAVRVAVDGGDLLLQRTSAPAGAVGAARLVRG
ncbi:hypothetical protein [Pseudonocardia spirodelae]|uniref:META domain-containing protein n=1 Tax=Pseudonocardia spirodelae TaxID=3133431 RepID=A0ABU8T4B1_9PSEU